MISKAPGGQETLDPSRLFRSFFEAPLSCGGCFSRLSENSKSVRTLTDTNNSMVSGCFCISSWAQGSGFRV